jgi:hypothetical protein
VSHIKKSKKLSSLLRKAEKRVAELEVRNGILENMWRYYRNKDLEVQRIKNLETWIEEYKKREGS